MKKVAFVLAVLAVAGLIGWRIYAKLTGKKNMFKRGGEAAVAVEIAPVRRMTIRDVGFFTGTVQARSQFTVAPKVAGRLEKLLVNIGDIVKRGQQVAMLDSDEYLLQVEQARAELAVAEANVAEAKSALEVAKREYERVKELREKAIASESELDSVEAQYKAKEAKYLVALAQVDQKRAALKAAEVRLSYTQILAAWEEEDSERMVGERFVDEGAMLKANDPIVSILDLATVTVVMHVIERDYSKVTIGQAAQVMTDACPGEKFIGRVARIAPLLRESSRQARVEIEVPNPRYLLKPGMFARVEIEFAKHENVPVVPLTALVRREGRQGVFLADLANNRARFVPLSVGIISGGFAEVIEPELSSSVITIGQHLLEDGGAIILPGAKAQPTEGKATPPGRAGGRGDKAGGKR